MRVSYAGSIRTMSAGAMAIGMAVALATSTAVAQGSRATLAKAPAPGAAHASAALDDPTIVAIFDAANTWDIQTGNLAAKKGHDKAVREFGQMIAHDHTVVRQQGRDLASKLHVTPTPPKDFALAAEHDAAMKKLTSLSGEAFDKAFLEHEVAFHKAVIDAVKTSLLPATQNTELKDLEVKVAPAFQAHMMRAQQLLDDEAKEAH